jgi:Lrp/AsnC family leucine-responsive transcriptional regulator
MEAAGAIRGYSVKLDRTRLGCRDPVIVQVNLESHSDETFYTFGHTLGDIPELLDAFLISGDYNYFIRIAVQDTCDYERLWREKLYKIRGIRHSKSSFVLRMLKKSDPPLV